MKKKSNPLYTFANGLTLLRLLLQILLLCSVLSPLASYQLLNPLLFLFIISLDWFDGFFARILKQESLVGAVFDIAADHIIELSMWISFAYLKVIPIAIPLILIFRNILVDAVRSLGSQKGIAPFQNAYGKLSQFLVAGPFLRFFYAAWKGITFAFLLFLLPARQLLPRLDLNHSWIGTILPYLLVLICVFLSLLRGIPVLIEFLFFPCNEGISKK